MTFVLLAMGILLLPGVRSVPAPAAHLSTAGRPKSAAAWSGRLPVLAGLGMAVAVALLAGPFALVLAAPFGAAGWWVVRRLARNRRTELDRPSTALVLDLISAALLSGLPVPSAIDAVERAVSGYGTGTLAVAVAPFRLVGRLQLLGEDPAQAWAQLTSHPDLRPVAAAGTALCPQRGPAGRGVDRNRRRASRRTSRSRVASSSAHRRVGVAAVGLLFPTRVRVSGGATGRARRGRPVFGGGLRLG